MDLRNDAKYAVACVTSMGVRITPDSRMAVQNSHYFYMQATSAESNVLNVSSSLGRKCLVMTRFVKGSPIAEFIKRELRARNIDYVGPDIAPDGPWGCRHQFNIADSGFGVRGARVWNDRAGEVGRTICPEDFDLDRIFGEEGVAILHLSGLIAAMSEETTRSCVAVAKAAKTYGTRISFDLNYRASFWEGREEELRASFREIASLADILVGNEEDFQLCLGVPGPEAGGKDLKAKIDGFRDMITEVRRQFPNVTVCATTLREVLSANVNEWGAIVNAGDEWFVENPRPIEILDRVGGGDGFTGGLLYAIGQGMPAEKWIGFGWACGALAASSLNDYAEPVDEKQVWAVYSGNARIQR